ncbi:nuclear transport factor 2 family protein [Lichenicola sp.]|uniref:nuclear transport factor 2 family protein n=1 Tax=Lichenicola sp. TaxID=2804529 RepID=UPI003B007F05
MTMTALGVMTAILADPENLDHVRSLVTPDVTYVSLNYDNPDLKRVMPWCGTSYGPEAIVQTFVDVGRYWRIDDFQVEAELDDGEKAAIFGRFTYTSMVLSQTVTSPFVVLGRVKDGICHHMQFMEDTFATTASFRSGGHWMIRSNPGGDQIEV